MTSRRLQKAAEAIREVVSMAILTEMRDPRVANVTVTYVEMAADMRSATIHVSIMGSDTAQQLCLHGLQSATGFLQSKIAKNIDTRYTPRLRFALDMGVKRSIEIAKLLKSVLPADAEPAAEAAEDETDVETEAAAGESEEAHEPDHTPHVTD
jgi:ribosome-binding factor A